MIANNSASNTSSLPLKRSTSNLFNRAIRHYSPSNARKCIGYVACSETRERETTKSQREFAGKINCIRRSIA